MAHTIYSFNGKILADITNTAEVVDSWLQLEALAELLHIKPEDIETSVVFK